jgi:hypothetical protein
MAMERLLIQFWSSGHPVGEEHSNLDCAKTLGREEFSCYRCFGSVSSTH